MPSRSSGSSPRVRRRTRLPDAAARPVSSRSWFELLSGRAETQPQARSYLPDTRFKQRTADLQETHESQPLLLELELRLVRRPVPEPQDDDSTRVRPGVVRLPDVVVLVVAGVVGEAALTRRDRRLDRAGRIVGRAGHRLGLRIAGGEDVESLVAAETELDRDGAARVDRVDRRLVVDRLEEALEGELHDVRADERRLQAVRILRTDDEGVNTGSRCVDGLAGRHGTVAGVDGGRVRNAL